MVRNERKVAERSNAACPSIAGRTLRIADRRPLREKSAILLPSLHCNMSESLRFAKIFTADDADGADNGNAESSVQRFHPRNPRNPRSIPFGCGFAALRSLVAMVFPALQKNRPGRVMREPPIRAILRYFEIFRVNLSSAFKIHHHHHSILCHGNPSAFGGGVKRPTGRGNKKGEASRKNGFARCLALGHIAPIGFLCDEMIEPKFWWLGQARWECSRRCG